MNDVIVPIEMTDHMMEELQSTCHQDQEEDYDEIHHYTRIENAPAPIG